MPQATPQQLGSGTPGMGGMGGMGMMQGSPTNLAGQPAFGQPAFGQPGLGGVAAAASTLAGGFVQYSPPSNQHFQMPGPEFAEL